jgi:hypothetical protein
MPWQSPTGNGTLAGGTQKKRQPGESPRLPSMNALRTERGKPPDHSLVVSPMSRVTRPKNTAGSMSVFSELL